MSNSIFDWPASLKRFVRFTTAKSEDVNDALDQLSTGLDAVEADIARAVKLPVGTADQTLPMAAGQRAGLLLGFDALGNIAGISGGGRWRGDWLTATAYAVTDYYRDPVSKNIYTVVVAHTSTSVAADLAAGNIRLAIDVADVEAQRVLAQAAATTATTQAGTATTQAGIATTKAGEALASANSAASHAGAATTQAGIATTKAGEAQGSAASAAADAIAVAEALALIADGPVVSVNGKTGIVRLDANALSITYNLDGTIDTVTEDGVTKTFAYNLDGTINTVSWPVDTLTRTETYSYTDGVLTGMTAVEA